MLNPIVVVVVDVAVDSADANVDAVDCDRSTNGINSINCFSLRRSKKVSPALIYLSFTWRRRLVVFVVVYANVCVQFQISRSLRPVCCRLKLTVLVRHQQPL